MNSCVIIECGENHSFMFYLLHYAPFPDVIVATCFHWRDHATTAKSVPTLTSVSLALTRDSPTTMPLRGLMTRGSLLSSWGHQGQEEELSGKDC